MLDLWAFERNRIRNHFFSFIPRFLPSPPEKRGFEVNSSGSLYHFLAYQVGLCRVRQWKMKERIIFIIYMEHTVLLSMERDLLCRQNKENLTFPKQSQKGLDFDRRFE